MEPIPGASKASTFKPEDFMSNMPDNVVTNIMDRLPLRDAVRTCILSRSSRFKWSLLSQLVFDKNFFECFKDPKDRIDVGRIISSILLQIRGVVTKFVLSIDETCYFVRVEEEINHWIVFLSRIGIKDLILENTTRTPLKLSAHLFSCMELTRLKLVNCCFDHPASFNGFPDLSSLELCQVKFENKKFVKFFTQCPILENLKLSHHYGISLYLKSKVNLKLVEIAKLANLKRLSLLLYMVDKTSSNSILELVGFLPNLEELHLDFMWCKITEGVAEKRCPTTFPCLKKLNLSDLDISNGIGLSYALQMISSFPYLQTLEITSSYSEATLPTPEICSPEAHYSTMGLLQLRSVVLIYLRASENEVRLIRSLLACSPFLKDICIVLHMRLTSDEKFMFASKLLNIHGASPAAEIFLY